MSVEPATDAVDRPPQTRLPRLVVVCAILGIVGALFALAYTQVTIFVIQPIGAVPEGVTLLLSRQDEFQFIDSADAWCERNRGGVSLFCRASALAKVADKDNILMRLPYSETLYLTSTDGATYDR